jgi:hypothetical protein
VLTLTLLAVAFVAGVAGTWSPCGFSIIETISAPRRGTVLSCVTFAAGACSGGAATFGAVAVLGAAVFPSGGRLAAIVVSVVAVATAIAEARGLAIAPQIRRQVPEHWRRVLPLPAAAALYGVLLGSGFATFVYTFAVWSVATIAFILGSPTLGLFVGLAFGIGRALPVAVIAPIAHLRMGRNVIDAIAQRPATWRVIRRTAAAGLLAVAIASTGLTTAGAAVNVGAGWDPSVSGDVIAWTSPTGGVVQHEGQSDAASVPAFASLGGSLLAWRTDGAAHLVRLADMSPVLDVDVPDINALAVSDSWLVTRTQSPDRTTTLSAHSLVTPEDVHTIVTVTPPTQLGRPALDGDLLVYHVARHGSSTIVAVDLSTSVARVVRRSTSSLLTNPSVLAGELVYDRQTNLSQLVEIGPLSRGGTDRVVYRLGAPATHDAGHENGYSRRTRTPRPPTAKWRVWTTALSAQRVYVTLLPRVGAASGARVVSVLR